MCIMSWQITSQRLRGQQGNVWKLILTKSKNSCDRRSDPTEVKLDLYNVEINAQKFQVNISKDGKNPENLSLIMKGQKLVHEGNGSFRVIDNNNAELLCPYL